VVVVRLDALGVWTGYLYRRDPERPAEKTGKTVAKNKKQRFRQKHRATNYESVAREPAFVRHAETTAGRQQKTQNEF